MTITFRGSIVTFSETPRQATQQLALALLSALEQSYPERFK